MNEIRKEHPLIMFESDALAMDFLEGTPPLIDSFAATLSLSRVGYPPDIKELMQDIRYIPGFAFFMGPQSAQSFYRLSACHPFLPSAVPEKYPPILHIGLGKYDFAVHFMSLDFQERGPFYERYPVVMTFSQAWEGMSPPKGGQPR